MLLLRPAVASAVLLALVACGGGDLVLPNEGQPADVTKLAGDAQTGTILEPVHDSLVVRVTDSFGNPVQGIEISWTAQGGGDVQPTTVMTGADGRAAAQRTLGSQPGSYGTTAVAAALPEDVVTFTTTAVAAKLVLVTQPAATAASGVAFDPQPVIELQDPQGAPLAREGVTVTVQIASGDGTLHGTTSRATDASGRAAFTDLSIVGSPGARTLIFAASGYAPATSTPVSLGVGAPASIAVSAGDGQTAQVGTAVPVAPAVVVRDAGGTPVAGVAVVFAVKSGGGSVTGGNATTGADGVATVGSWTLGNTAGPNALTATAAADNVSGNPVTFTATATGGSADPGKSSVKASPGTITASSGGSASTITVVVRDAQGNPLAGQTVTVSATGGGVTLSQPAATDASGTTTAILSATTAGDHVVTAVTGSVTLGSATVKVNADVPSPSATTVEVPNGTAGVRTDIQVTLQDQFGNPVGGAASQLSLSVSGANTVGSLSVSSQPGGVYLAGYTPVVSGTDLIDVRVGGVAVPGSPFTSTVAPGAPDPKKSTADVPSSGQVLVPMTITVRVNDSQGNLVGHGGDQVTITPEHYLALTVSDHGDGTYSATWTPVQRDNNANVSITLNGTPIAGSPFKTRISGF